MKKRKKFITCSDEEFHQSVRLVYSAIKDLIKRKTFGKSKLMIEAFVEGEGKVKRFKISQKAYNLCCIIRERFGVPLHEIYKGACGISEGNPSEESLLQYLDLRYNYSVTITNTKKK